MSNGERPEGQTVHIVPRRTLACHQLQRRLRRLATFFVEGSLFWRVATLLALSWDVVPAVAFFRLSASKKVVL